MKKFFNILGIIILSIITIIIVVYLNSMQPCNFSAIILLGIPLTLISTAAAIANTIKSPQLPLTHLRSNEKILYKSQHTRYTYWNGIGGSKQRSGYFTITNQRLIISANYFNYHTYKRHRDIEFKKKMGELHVKDIKYNENWDTLAFEGEGWNVKVRVDNTKTLLEELKKYIET